MIDVKKVGAIIAEKGYPDQIFVGSNADIEELQSIKRLVTIETTVNAERYLNQVGLRYGRAIQVVKASEKEKKENPAK